MFHLDTILQSVAQGKMTVEEAKSLIEKQNAAKKRKREKIRDIQKSASMATKEGLKGAFGKLIQHISENIPQIEKIQENISQNFSPIGFSSNIPGIESKLSVFRGVQVSPDSTTQENQVVGSQWFSVNFSDNAEVKENKFTAVQFSAFSVVRSDLCQSHFSLVRLSNITLQEARFEKNKLGRSTWSDVSLTESDFTENILSKTDLSGTVINKSRLAKLNLASVDFKDCEFDNCDIQGVSFDNCSFRECTFSHIHLVCDSLSTISGRKLSGKTFSHCKTLEEFLAALDQS